MTSSGIEKTGYESVRVCGAYHEYSGLWTREKPERRRDQHPRVVYQFSRHRIIGSRSCPSGLSCYSVCGEFRDNLLEAAYIVNVSFHTGEMLSSTVFVVRSCHWLFMLADMVQKTSGLLNTSRLTKFIAATTEEVG